MTDLRLYVDFIGELTPVEPGDELTFGRQADLHIDDNRHLHRVLGRFWSRGDAWWLTNEGRSITIQIADADSRSSVQLAPGSEIALSFPNSVLRFRAGITDYEVIVRVPDRGADDADDEDDPLDADDEEDGGETIALGDLHAHRASSACCCSRSPRRRCATRTAPTSCRPTAPSPAASAGRSRSSTASSTTSATASPSSASVGCAARSTSWPPTAGGASSTTPSSRGSSTASQLDRLPPEPD